MASVRKAKGSTVLVVRTIQVSAWVGCVSQMQSAELMIEVCYISHT